MKRTIMIYGYIIESIECVGVAGSDGERWRIHRYALIAPFNSHPHLLFLVYLLRFACWLAADSCFMCCATWALDALWPRTRSASRPTGSTRCYSSSSAPQVLPASIPSWTSCAPWTTWSRASCSPPTAQATPSSSAWWLRSTMSRDPSRGEEISLSWRSGIMHLNSLHVHDRPVSLCALSPNSHMHS